MSIVDFIRVEEHLSKKLNEACGLFKNFVVIGICETFNGQPLSRAQFQRIYVNACRFVIDYYFEDCIRFEEFCPIAQPVIRRIIPKALQYIRIFHYLEWQILVSQLL